MVVILQSIFLAYKLSGEDFIRKIKAIDGLFLFLLIVHSCIVLCLVVFLFMIERRISDNLDVKLRKRCSRILR